MDPLITPNKKRSNIAAAFYQVCHVTNMIHLVNMMCFSLIAYVYLNRCVAFSVNMLVHIILLQLVAGNTRHIPTELELYPIPQYRFNTIGLVSWDFHSSTEVVNGRFS